MVFFFHRLGHFELSSPSPSEISYTANTPYCKEPFLIASARVFHQSGLFSTQPWPFKNLKSPTPTLPGTFFKEQLVSEKRFFKTQENDKCTCRNEILHVYSQIFQISKLQLFTSCVRGFAPFELSNFSRNNCKNRIEK